jgi:hypothetical protein
MNGRVFASIVLVCFSAGLDNERTKMNCLQNVIRILTSITIIVVASCWGGDARAANPPKKAGLRAVSLRVLSEQSQASHGDLSPVLAELGGLKRIVGYLVDDENKDILIYGTVNTVATNKLYTEDLVVALKNTWMKYSEKQGNTYMYSHPGCSIDPDPETWQRLDAISSHNSLTQDAQQNDKMRKQWRTICEEWQHVRVLGLPYNCRFSSVLVKADNDLKLLVDGNDELNIPGFTSLLGLKEAIVRNAITKQQQISVPISAMNRYWFYPGQNVFEEDDGVVMIKQCPVILLTEEAALGRKGSSGPGLSIDPLAQKYCEDFSHLYSKIAEERPIYSDLENLFRFVALAKVIYYKELPAKVGLNLDSQLKNGLDLAWMLDDFPVQEVSVAKQLRGRSAIKEINDERVEIWLKSCGGVGIDINVRPEDFRPPSPVLRRLKKAFLVARAAAPKAQRWDIPADSDAAMDLNTSVALTALNSGNRWRCTVLVQYIDSKYQLYTDGGRVFEGDTVSGLMIALRASGALDGRHLTVKTAGFDQKDLPGFRAALRLQAEKFDPELALAFVNGDTKELTLHEIVASPGTALDPPSQTDILTLEKAVSENASLGFLVRWEGKNQKCNVEIHGEKAEFTGAMVRALLERFRPYGASSQSLLDSVVEEKSKLIMRLKLQNKNIQIRIRSEAGVIELGVIYREYIFNLA